MRRNRRIAHGLIQRYGSAAMTFDDYRTRCDRIHEAARILVDAYGYTGAAERTGLQPSTIRRALRRPDGTHNPTAGALLRAAAQTRRSYALARARYIDELRAEQDARDGAHRASRDAEAAAEIAAIAQASSGRIVLLADRRRAASARRFVAVPRTPKDAA